MVVDMKLSTDARRQTPQTPKTGTGGEEETGPGMLGLVCFLLTNPEDVFQDVLV